MSRDEIDRILATPDGTIPLSEAAQRLGLSYTQAYDRVMTGELKGRRGLNGYHWFVERTSLEAYVPREHARPRGGRMRQLERRVKRLEEDDRRRRAGREVAYLENRCPAHPTKGPHDWLPHPFLHERPDICSWCGTVPLGEPSHGPYRPEP